MKLPVILKARRRRRISAATTAATRRRPSYFEILRPSTRLRMTGDTGHATSATEFFILHSNLEPPRLRLVPLQLDYPSS
jgi:hypothetical protein